MKQWLKKRKARGFTLVELLIVIVIIGILAGSLLLVMGSGTDKANATKIASDLRTIKAAMLMYYADNGEFNVMNTSADMKPFFEKYVDHVPVNKLGKYTVETNVVGGSDDDKVFYAKFEFDEQPSKIADALEKIEGVKRVGEKIFYSRIGTGE